MMNKEKELLPCPFCGGAAEMIEIPHVPRGTDYTPRCKKTSCCGRLTKKWAYRETAVDMWNRRVSEKQSAGEWIGIEYDGYADGYPVYEVFECSACGNEWRGDEPPSFCPDCGAKMKEGV